MRNEQDTFGNIVKNHNFTKELKDFEYEVKFNIKNYDLDILDCLKEVERCFKNNSRFLLYKFRCGDKLITKVDIFQRGKTEYSFFTYHGVKMLKAKRHKVIKTKPFNIFKNDEALLINKSDFSKKLSHLSSRFKRHKYSLLSMNEIIKTIKSPKVISIGEMIKTRVKDFILDLKDGRIYSVCISFCNCKNIIQRQLEIEYSGYLDGFKRQNNNEKQIINQTLCLSKIIYDKTPLSLESTIERKFDFVNLNTLHSKINRPIFISGPHGSGKTTLLYRMLNKRNKLFVKNDFEIDFVKEFPSIKSLNHFERSLIRLLYRKLRTDYAISIAKDVPNKVVLTDRSIYDSMAYINVYKKLGWISKKEFKKLTFILGMLTDNSDVIILNPSFEVIKSRLNQRKIEGKRHRRDAIFKHEDTDLFIHSLHNAFKKFKHKPNIIYIEDNSDEEIERILSKIDVPI